MTSARLKLQKARGPPWPGSGRAGQSAREVAVPVVAEAERRHSCRRRPVWSCWRVVGLRREATSRQGIRPSAGTLPAIFTALTGYIAVLFLVVWRYPSLMTPLTALVPISGNQDFTSRLGANILVVHQGMDTIYDASGHAMNRAAVQSLCPSMNSGCPAQHHLMEALRYQPGSRIPDFHLLLACGYFALGAIAVAVVWWLVRRTSLSAG